MYSSMHLLLLNIFTALHFSLSQPPQGHNNSSFYMYRRNSSDLNSFREFVKNNSVALPDFDISSNYGIGCASTINEEHSAISWHYPNKEIIGSRFSNQTNPIFTSSLNGRVELRVVTNFANQFNGIYTCSLNISNTLQYLYLGLYKRSKHLEPVILTVNIMPGQNSDGVLISNCTSIGLPAEQVHWFLDNHLVSVGERRTVVVNYTSVIYSTFLIFESSEVAFNGNECLKCQVIANGTEGNSSCYMTIGIVPTVSILSFNGSQLQWEAETASPNSFPVISYDVKVVGGQCNSSNAWSWNASSLRSSDSIYQVPLTSLDTLEAGATYSAKIRASNGFASSDWSNTVIVNTSTKRPSGIPQNLISESNSTFIFLSWSEVDCSERNGFIDSYFVMYQDLLNMDVRSKRVHVLETVLMGLLPSTVYNISLAASNMDGMGPYINLSVETTELHPTTENFLPSDSNTFNSTDITHPSATSTFCGSLGIQSQIDCVIAAAAVAIFFLLLLLCCCCGFFILYRMVLKKKLYSGLHTEELIELNGIDHPSMAMPTIDIFPEDMEAFEGEHVIFNVSVSGHPPPMLMWYYDDIEIEKDPSIDISGNGTLSITSVEREHSGIYRLMGKNSVGTCSAELELSLVEEEDFPLRRPESMASMVDSSAVPVASFEDYIARHHLRNNRKFHIEFVSLESCSDKSVTTGMSIENRNYNRFRNIAPYDDNLVVLEPVDQDEDCQNVYINASYIDGYGATKFIATQGPLPHTLSDFWRMVWQKKSQVIVMLCNIVEGRRVRCHQYWPDTGTHKYGPISVQHLEEKKLADYVVRTFEVTMPKVSDESLKVKQYQYISWPHHSVPDNAGSFISFCKTAVAPNNDTSMGPMVVHDSAGVGRTGMFIALNTALYQAREDGEVNIMDIISNMRQQRMKMVQTLSEYVFIHDATLEALVCGETQIAVTNFRTTWIKLTRTDKETGKTGLEKQFQLLLKITPNPSEIDRTAALQWPHYNRSAKFLPRDQGRVVLSNSKCDYIHASFIDGYKKKKAFIIAQGPLKNTCEHFWQMIHQYRCRTIVMLSEVVEYNEEVCHQYWPEEGQATYGNLEVSLGTECSVGNMVTRTLKYRCKEEESEELLTIQQVQLLNWTPDGLCADYIPVVELMNNISVVQRQTGDHPIVVHCSDSVSRSAIFCAAMTAVEWFRTEAAVDIFQVVKSLRYQKPGAVLTVEQYSAIYSIVLAYADNVDNYANFHAVSKS